VCVVAIDSVPVSWALYCSPMRLRLPTSRRMMAMLSSTCWPGSVMRFRRLPWRVKMSMPSSSSSSMIAFDTPGCEVCSALAASVRFRLRRAAS